MDRLLGSLLWLTVMGLIAVCAGASVAFAYWGAIQIIGGQAAAGGTLLGLGVLLSGGTLLLCQYSNDLIDR